MEKIYVEKFSNGCESCPIGGCKTYKKLIISTMNSEKKHDCGVAKALDLMSKHDTKRLDDCPLQLISDRDKAKDEEIAKQAKIIELALERLEDTHDLVCKNCKSIKCYSCRDELTFEYFKQQAEKELGEGI